MFTFYIDSLKNIHRQLIFNIMGFSFINEKKSIGTKLRFKICIQKLIMYYGALRTEYNHPIETYNLVISGVTKF